MLQHHVSTVASEERIHHSSECTFCNCIIALLFSSNNLFAYDITFYSLKTKYKEWVYGGSDSRDTWLRLLWWHHSGTVEATIASTMNDVSAGAPHKHNTHCAWGGTKKTCLWINYHYPREHTRTRPPPPLVHPYVNKYDQGWKLHSNYKKVINAVPGLTVHLCLGHQNG